MWSHSCSTEVQSLRSPTENDGKLIKKLKKIIEDKYKAKIDGYWDFQKWFLEHSAEFWSEMWSFYGIICSKTYDKVIDQNIPMSESPKWFEGARLNYAENLLKYRDEKIAMIFTGEDQKGREPEIVTYAQMYTEAEKYAAAFRKLGLRKKDVVVCYMSNRKEAVIAMEAVLSIGAIWTGALPFLGAKVALNRFQQVKPKFLLTVDRFVHNKEEIEMLSKVEEVVDGLPSLIKVIIVASKLESRSKDISKIKGSCFLDEFLQEGLLQDGSVPSLHFEQLPFDHPVFINYTSGTTGLPKPIVHGCGPLLDLSRSLSLQVDASRNTIWFNVSPVGWITWNVFTFLNFIGCTVVHFEGHPFYLSPTYFWDLVEEFKISHAFLTSSIMDEFQKRGYVPTSKHSLKSLKVLLSGSSPLKPRNYEFVYEKIKADVHFSALYGLTEFMGFCIVPTTCIPVYKGELQAAVMDIQVVDDTGKPIFGEMGELVLARPTPSLALGVWGDDDSSIFRKYFAKYNGKFCLGDYGKINPDTNGFVVFCRSDETLKQRGCRFGSSEIYNVVEEFPEVRDSLCVSQYNKTMDERAILFLKIREGHIFNEDLVCRIRGAIKRELTVRHIPDIILEIQDIPYNMNGKKMEFTVKKIINKMPYNAETVVNPKSLKNYFNILELQDF